jgi:hypothetical protein
MAGQNRPFVRMRLYEEQAVLLLDLLEDERYQLVVDRAEAKSKGLEHAIYQKPIRVVSSMKDELARAMQEFDR